MLRFHPRRAIYRRAKATTPMVPVPLSPSPSSLHTFETARPAQTTATDDDDDDSNDGWLHLPGGVHLPTTTPLSHHHLIMCPNTHFPLEQVKATPKLVGFLRRAGFLFKLQRRLLLLLPNLPVSAQCYSWHYDMSHLLLHINNNNT